MNRLWLITIDCFRYDAIQYMPNLRRYIKNCLYFPKSLTQSAYTLKSIKSIFTGYEPHHFSFYKMSDLSSKYLSLPQLMQDRGYKTIGTMLTPLIETYDMDFAKHFDDYYGVGDFPYWFKADTGTPSVGIENTIDFLVPLIQKRDKPQEKTFYWTHFFDLHPPLKFESNYYTNLKFLDVILGFLLHFYNGTVIITGDHGEDIDYSHDKLLNDGTIYTPFIIGGISTKGKVNKIMRHIDIFPTICDILNVEKPDTEGKSIFNIKKDREGYCEFHTSGNTDLTCYTDHKFKLIWYKDNRKNWKRNSIKLYKYPDLDNDVKDKYPKIYKRFLNEIKKRKEKRDKVIQKDKEEQKIKKQLEKLGYL